MAVDPKMLEILVFTVDQTPLEVIDLDEDLSAVVVDGVDIEEENNVANAVNVLDADVVS